VAPSANKKIEIDGIKNGRANIILLNLKYLAVNAASYAAD
jgi:hypothetical protein